MLVIVTFVLQEVVVTGASENHLLCACAHKCGIILGMFAAQIMVGMTCTFVSEGRGKPNNCHIMLVKIGV